VLITRVHPEILDTQNLPKHSRDDKDFWSDRYRSIVELEAHLHRNGTQIVKFFLHLSKKEQKKRFLERVDEPDKNWKFSSSEFTRENTGGITCKHGDCLAETSTHHAPWYAVPADDKENARLIVSQIIMDVLNDLKMAYPKSTPKRRRELQAIGKLLAKSD
jgi:polyphosphate kinase 2 (PPK2 family)